MLRNSDSKFGSISIAIHWLSALIIVGQFAFGLYMLSLDYYDPDYKSLPHYHKSIGILFAILLGFRILWTRFNPHPKPSSGISELHTRLALLMHKILLGLLVLVVCMGYLISTAKGDSIMVFNWFEVPATLTSFGRQEDWAGELHYWFALSIIILASIHALAALKHHFIDGDNTLKKMLGKD